jgi:hypothetical protein
VFPALETESGHFPTSETYFPGILADFDSKAVSSVGKSFSKFRDQVGSERSRFTTSTAIAPILAETERYAVSLVQRISRGTPWLTLV